MVVRGGCNMDKVHFEFAQFFWNRMGNLMEELRSFIKSQVRIDDADLQSILSNFQVLTIGKDRFLLKPGQVANAYYFVADGGLRIYLEKEGKQVTGWLAFANDFFTDLESFEYGQPSQLYIQAIEKTTLYTIEKAKMEFLYTQFAAWQQFGRKVWQTAFLKVVNALLSFQTMTAEERYRAMMQQSDLLQKVPLKQLASYLGVTQTSLSRLRKKIT